jgi:pilus assembly protein Flp/PilA
MTLDDYPGTTLSATGNSLNLAFLDVRYVLVPQILTEAIRWITQRSRSERGASIVEYALLIALIAVVCIGAVTVLGGNTSSTLSGVGSSLGS